MIRRLHPTLLQGDITKNNYFEGWFQKVYIPEQNTSIIIIYGIATGNELTKTGFIQLLIPGHEVIHLDFPQHEVALSKRKHEVKLGPNYFSSNRIHIKNKRVQLDLDIIPVAKKAFQQNSMGNFYLVPGLPCYHSVLQVNSFVKGHIKINNELIQLTRLSGYLEKNWGTSFPEKYFWMHAQDPLNSNNQVLYSQAEIKWGNKTFIKHLGFIHLNGKSVDLRKMHRKHISHTLSDRNQLELSFNLLGLTFNFDLEDTLIAAFKSPYNGNMSNNILHNIDVPIQVKQQPAAQFSNTLLKGSVENSIYFRDK